MISQEHTFHIPVMGLAFTIDTPVKVARFGISSVVSIIEDRLVEMMRKHYYSFLQEKFKPITTHDPDYRAHRITDYLNLLQRIVRDQVEKMKSLDFTPGSEITKYFEMLPDQSRLRQFYNRMLETENETEKESLTIFLKSQVKPGSIDVNIMTKLDKNNVDQAGHELQDGSDAVAALRGYALSNLTDSSIVFSAGMNPRLFTYLEKFQEFNATGWAQFRKKIIIKVSDYRSALIQGKILAKKGIWVSEFRIESGLNCGGHAFATDGILLGPILEEFKTNRENLIKELHGMYNAAAEKKGIPVFERPHPLQISVQGGIGTAEEDSFLRSRYNISSTGWGTPFLLCPEATTVDPETLKLLQEANENTIHLSKNSPLGVRFYHLKGTTSDLEKQRRIRSGKPGSPCTEKHLVSNTEFTTEPICTASRKYQSYKIAQLKELNLPPEQFDKMVHDVTEKECLCVGLSNAASLVYNTTFVRKMSAVTICPGPNIVNFSKIVSLKQMVDHIYDRESVMTRPDRPHVFINELNLYLNYFRELIAGRLDDPKHIQYCTKFAKNILLGIDYYRGIAPQIKNSDQFIEGLEKATEELNNFLKLEETKVEI